MYVNKLPLLFPINTIVFSIAFRIYSQAVTQQFALNMELPIEGSFDGSNVPPGLHAVDSNTIDFGEPDFGGQAATWALDFYDGNNDPGTLRGVRSHTVLFGDVCDLEQVIIDDSPDSPS